MSGSKSVVKRRVDVETAQWHPAVLFDMLEAEQGRETAVTQLRAALAAVPDAAARLEVLRQKEGHEGVLAFTQPFLDREPLMLEVHRASQNARLCSEDRAALIALYRGRLVQKPEDPARLYLLARLIPDTDPESEALLRRSVESAGAPVQAWHALTIREMNRGRFDEAVEASRSLKAFDPRDSHFAFHEYEALWAAGRFQEALEAANAYGRLERLDGYIIVVQAALLHQLGRDSEIEALIQAYLAILNADGESQGNIGLWREFLEAHVAYVRGDASLIGAPGAKETHWPDGSPTAFHAAIIAGDVERIEKQAAKRDGISPEDPSDALLAAIALFHLGQSEKAQAWLNKAAEKFEKTPFDIHLRIAQWLRGQSAPDSRELNAHLRHTDEKLLLLVALGLRHPESREPLLAAARPLNFDLRPPHLLLKSILE